MQWTKWFTAGRVVALVLCLALLTAVGLLRLLVWADLAEPLASLTWPAETSATVPSVSSFPQTEPLPEDIVALMPSDRPKGGAEGLLARELARQAILIAARDEMGLRTRDASLREILLDVDNKALGAIRPLVLSPGDGRMAIDVQRFGTPPDKNYDTIIAAGDGDRLTYLARELETHSRTTFVESLERLGYKKQPGGPREGATERSGNPPAELCDRFDFVSQFAAVRDWHAAMRTGGETPERLAGLVRGYSNLGLLTVHHWSSACKAYRARSLLYAERLLRLTGVTADSLRMRAYARALTGLPAAALDDLERANEIAKKGDSPPGFAAVLEAYCRGDAKRLRSYTKSGTNADRMLTLLLRLENAILAGSKRLIENAANEIREQEPGCSRGLEALLRQSMPLGTMRTAQHEALTAHREWLYRPLSRSDLPLPIKLAAVAEDPQKEAEFRQRFFEKLLDDQALRDGTGEPSLVAFARLIEEEGFYLAWRVISIDRQALGVNADERIEATLPWAWHHPFRAYLEALSWDDDANAAFRNTAFQQLGREQLVPAYEPVHRLFTMAVPSASEEANNYFWKNCDEIMPDLVWLAGQTTTQERQRQVRRLERVAPHAAVTVALLAKHDGDRVAGRAAEWERRFADDWAVLTAIGELHLEELNQEDAIRCFKAAIDVLPEHATMTRLAEVHLYFGDDERFLQTLEDSLAYPSHGLEHARACARIANYHMSAGHYRQALPYAKRAADSYSGWGLDCLADCYEGLGEFDAAEELLRAIGERYRGSGAGWYMWCLRTGAGDLEAARAAAQEQIARWKTYSASYQAYLPLIEQAEGRPEAAMRWFQENQDSEPSYRSYCAGLIADELGQTELRDELFAKAISVGGEIPYSVAYLLSAFQRDLSGEPIDSDAAIENVRRVADQWGTATECYYALGRFLENRGRLEQAERFYRLAATSPATGVRGCTLAAIALRRQNKDIGERRLFEADEVADAARDHYSGALGYYSLGRYRAALLRSEAALRALPDFEPALNLRAYSLAGLERFDEAIDALNAIYEAAPRRNDARVFASRLKECLGDHRGAIAGYEAVLESGAAPSEKAAAHINLGWLRAACIDPAMRDAAAAHQHADAAETFGAEPHVTSRVRAAALAAEGKFEEAVQMAEEARPHVFGADRYLLDEQLALYRDGRPYERHERWWRSIEEYANENPGDVDEPRPAVEAPRPIHRIVPPKS